ncbi:MAG: hypothetical protein U5Q03_09120 [Bacteroidota bacterium]|nr:hypothetical protein [Bacteroidota bacterium]
MQNLNAQKLLVLEKKGKFKTYMYPEGSAIMLSIDDTLMVQGRITSLKDSVLQLNGNIMLELSRIDHVYRERELVQFISAGALLAGLTYFVLTGFNRTLNKEYPILPAEDILLSAAVMGSGILLYQFKFKKFELGEKWQLKILDFSFED